MSNEISINQKGLFAPRGILALTLVVAAVARTSYLWNWQDPYDVHHVDEHFLPYEAIALWEGVSPRELGWPASTTRLLLSASYFVDMLIERRSALLGSQLSPPSVMEACARWGFDSLEEPVRLYQIGRWLSVCLGLLQVVAAFWAIRRWCSARAGIIGAFCCAMSPIAVEFSQLLLTDILGVLLVTLLMGLLAGESSKPGTRTFWMGILLGSSVATKYHFAIWLLPSLVYIWLRPNTCGCGTIGDKAKHTLILAAAAAGSLLIFVPWIWTNPVLIAKEVAGILLYSAGRFRPAHGSPLGNIVIATSGFGWLAIGGLLPGFVGWRRLRFSGIPIAALLMASLLVIASTGRMHSRWGLLFFPAIVLIAAFGFDYILSTGRGRLALNASILAITALSLLGLRQLIYSQRSVGEIDPYGQAQRWFLENMRPGDRIAVDSLYSRHLPHSRRRLEAMLAEIAGHRAYAEKMDLIGMNPITAAEPFRLAVLNDEYYAAYWLRRELAYRADSEGFDLYFYDNIKKSDSIMTDAAIKAFLRGLSSPGEGYDALLLNEPRDIGVAPDRTFQNSRGLQYFLYLRRPLKVGAPRHDPGGKSGLDAESGGRPSPAS